MRHSEKLTSVLNDLVWIQNDRIEGYLNVIESFCAKDNDLQMIFEKIIRKSKVHLSQLCDLVAEVGDEVEKGKTTNGGIFRSWMANKTIFSLSDRTSFLEFCETGEYAVLKAYDMALASNTNMIADVRQILMDQISSIKVDHDFVKEINDFQKGISEFMMLKQKKITEYKGWRLLYKENG